MITNIEARGFNIYSAGETYMDRVASFFGGVLVETMVVEEPVLPDVTVELRIIMGGVTFEDGTIVKELTAADFNELGECKVRAILPTYVGGHAYPAVCHVRLIYQDGVLIGGHE